MLSLILRHGLCFIFGWLAGPYMAAFAVQIMVAVGIRGNFTPLDFVMRVLMIVAFELLLLYATRWLTADIPDAAR